jgi:hypothetical protein
MNTFKKLKIERVGLCMTRQGHSRDESGPTAPHCAIVSGFGVGLGQAPQPNWASGLASAAATMLGFFCFFVFLILYQHCKRLYYNSCGMGVFIFKPILRRLVFSLTFPWTGWFRNYWFWDMLQSFLPFNSRFLDVNGQKLCEKSALHMCQELWPWNCESRKESAQRPSQHTFKIV